MVEFMLVLPLLLVLLLGIADFGRVFAAGITLEAAARNAAEVVAEEYRRTPPDGVYADQTLPAPSPGDPAYYQPLHELAARTACREAGGLQNATFDPDTDQCAFDPGAGEAMPVFLVCIHDDADPLCGESAFGATIPPQCSALQTPPENTMEGGTELSRYVEVRICYRFSMLINLPVLPLDDVWLQKSRVFTVAYYPPPPTPEPPSEPPPPSPGEIPPTPTPEESASQSPEESAAETPAETPTPAPETPTPAPETPTPSPEATP
ncbi:MAG: TadE/TadG family type IV pilus assembly protein [Chloroflexota bacterium]